MATEIDPLCVLENREVNMREEDFGAQFLHQSVEHFGLWVHKNLRKGH